ncbi:MAG: hypothetical protein JXO22_04400 [Phycisphaerae bacterium]|nr:hypothetical protein [Phycisphaerae bacterium]
MSNRYLISTIACVLVTGLSVAVAQENRSTAQIELRIIQIDPQNSVGAEIMSAWNAEIEKSRKPAEDRPEKAEATPTPGKTGDDKDVTFDVLACDADKLFRGLLDDQEEPGACKLTMAQNADIVLKRELWNSGAGKLISAPRLMAQIGQESGISIGRKVPYMVKRDDGSFVIKESDELREGISADVKVSDVKKSESGDASTCQVDIHLKISSVTGRQPIADVPFDVGPPIISSRETASTIRIATSTDVVMRTPQTNQDDLPVFVAISVKIIETPEP